MSRPIIVFVATSFLSMISSPMAVAEVVTPKRGVAFADLAITKTDGRDSIYPGEFATYTIVARNNGPDAANGALVVDDFLEGTAACEWECVGAGGGTCTAAGQDDISDSVNLPQGSSVTYSATCFITSEAPPVLSNTASVNSSVLDPAPANNSATDTTQFLGTPLLNGTKSWSGSAYRGGSITYTIVVGNAGSATQFDTPGDELVDVLPPSLILQSASATSGTVVADVVTNTVTWNGEVERGANIVTLTINTRIRDNFWGEVRNQATLHFDDENDGDKGATALTDDRSVSGFENATVFSVPGAPIPLLGFGAMMLLSALLAGMAGVVIRRTAVKRAR